MRIFFTLLLVCCTLAAYAQLPCPPAASCTPGAASSSSAPAFGSGITSVQIGSVINKTSLNYTEGYKDFSCTDSATVFVGVPISITITVGSSIPENVRVWIDYNNNGVFENPQERVFSSDNKNTHTGSFIPSNTAITNTYLRVRVAADAFTAPTPTPCSTPQFSQVEDYSLRLVNNTTPPTADFTASPLYTCNGLVNFTDQSLNVPTTWEWDFGDGSTVSTFQSPTHTYTQPGTYDVKLIAGNAAGFDTLTRLAYVTYNDTVPKAASCTPITLSDCCGYGILNFTLGSINKSSGDGSEGYKDFSCQERTELIVGKPYPFSITTGALAQDTRIWVDTNNNGSFEANELIVQVLDSANPSGMLMIPFNNHLDTALRMRVMTDFESNPFGPCTNLTHGQAEDYTVILKENTLPPVAQIKLAGQPVQPSYFLCNLTAVFENATENSVSSYEWNFGDGNTSTLPAPTHTYGSTGTYTIQLIATGPFGADTISKNITVGTPPVAGCTASSSGSFNNGISRVVFNTIDKSSPDFNDSYQDYTCTDITTLNPGLSYNLDVYAFDNFDDAAAWIDFNNDGQFDLSERVMSSLSGPTIAGTFIHRATVTLPATVVKNQPLRLRVIIDNNLPFSPTACSNIINGQVEDYTVIVRPDSTPPVADFRIDTASLCSGVVGFLNTSTGLVTSSNWDFDNGFTSTDLNPTQPLSAGTYDVKLVVSGILGTDSITQTVTIPQAPIATTCLAPTLGAGGSNNGIARVSFATINQSSGDANEGYRDFSCSYSTNVQPGQTYTLSVEMFDNLDDAIAWIDYNNDGQFDVVTEQVMSSTSSSGFPATHTASVLIPSNAVKNTPLRMRVIGENFLPTGLGACYNINGGQAEDYAVIVQPDSVPPVANFSLDTASLCTGNISFINTSTGLATNSSWSFGSGITSTASNPVVPLSVGTYSVKLVVSGILGADSVTKTVIIPDAPIATTCLAPTNFANNFEGISRVKFSTIDQISGTATEGYRDFSCSYNTTVKSNQSYTLDVEVFDPNDAARAWIDYNNDGQFDPITERVLDSPFASGFPATHTSTVLIPTTAIRNVPLRMRVISDNFFPTVGSACFTINGGQAEDYAIVIEPDSIPPVASFEIDTATFCSGVVTFINTSTGLTTNSSWDFDNGVTSSAINPAVSLGVGTYDVELIVSGVLGSDTITQTVTINPSPITTSCLAPTIFANDFDGITKVDFAGISNSSGAGSEGYKDFSCIAAASVKVGQSYTLDVQVVDGFDDVVAWIDYNNDAQFSDAERVMLATNAIFTFPAVHSTTVTIPNGAVVGVPLRMRIISDNFYDPLNGACFPIFNGQAEDYSVIVERDSVPPVANFEIDTATICSGVVSFINTSTGLATNSSWDFGSGFVSTATNPTQTFAIGTYTIRLAVSGVLGNDTITQTLTLGSSPIATTCLAPTIFSNDFEGIAKVDFAGISNRSGSASEGYKDFSCLTAASVKVGQSYTLDVEMFNAFDDAVAWIDYNNDGQFDLSERVMLATNTAVGTPAVQSATVTIPGNAILSTPLRMRVISQNFYNTFNGACFSIFNGQAEDYTVIVEPDSVPPVANFEVDPATLCNGTVSFINTSTGLATTSSWDFGSGFVSSVTNPTQTFATGTYTIRLAVSGVLGNDTITKIININPTLAATTCLAPTIFGSNFEGIAAVDFANISSRSGDASEGYKDFTCLRTNLKIGQSYTLDVEIFNQFDDVVAWIDYNNDNQFDVSERIMLANTLAVGTPPVQSVSVTIPSGAVVNTPLRMRVISQGFYDPANGACFPIFGGQAEDYAVIVEPDSVPPVANFEIDTATLCSGTVSFINTSTGLATNSSWDFGSGFVSSVTNPTQTFATGTYTIRLAVSGVLGNDTITKTLTISSSPVSTTCLAPTLFGNNFEGIANVSFGNINNRSNGASAGYEDFTCIQTTVKVGQSYTLDVEMFDGFDDAVAWIDYDNNGQFDVSERVLLSLTPTFGFPPIHSATVTIPSGVVANTPLRMRVLADNFYNTINGACYNIAGGQAEDYAIIVEPDSVPPVASFEIDSTTLCSGSISFENTSTGLATNASWNFGNGSTSTLQNPSQAFTPGTYTVTLTVSGVLGSSTTTQTLTINPSPMATTCLAPTSFGIANEGIARVSFGGINQTSGDASEGYQDFSCTAAANVTVGQSYTLNVEIFNGFDDAVAWIDYNNDSQFDLSERVLFVNTPTFAFPPIHSATVTIPVSAVKNTPLRMRVLTDNFYNVANGACYNITNGQAEDYAVIVTPDSIAPTANFEVDTASLCSGTIGFINTSTGLATNASWDFGGGVTSTDYNPAVALAVGTYTVTLTVSGVLGTSTITKTVVIPETPIATTCLAPTIFGGAFEGIAKVSFATINQISGDASEGYRDFGCSYNTTVQASQSYTLSVEAFTSNHDVATWIDYNNDGQFDASERVMFSTFGSGFPPTHTATVTIPAAATRSIPLRMRVIGDNFISNLTNGCYNITNGQAEDYAVIVAPDSVPPVASFEVDTATLCTGLVSFINTSTGLATNASWDFGGGVTSSAFNPVQALAVGTYTVTLTVSGTLGTSTITGTVVVPDAPASTTCLAPTTGTNTNDGIARVQFATINQSSGDATEGYRDFSCSYNTTVQASQNYTLSVEMFDNTDDAMAWIDYNNDGQFDLAERVMFSTFSTGFPPTHTVSVTIPATAVRSVPLRMRVIGENFLPTAGVACYNIINGQAEDYAVIVAPDSIPPTANFEVDTASLCSGVVSFINTSTGLVTSSSWDFGGVATSTVRNPSQLLTPGTYSVVLTVSSTLGSSTITKTLTVPAAPIATTCLAPTIFGGTFEGIARVGFNNINQVSGPATEGYSDFSCSVTDTVQSGQSYTLDVEVFDRFDDAVAWIDYNNDGQFSSIERVMLITTNAIGTPFIHSTNVTIPATGVVLNTPLRMRVIVDNFYNTFDGACYNIANGQAEDYSIVVTSATLSPVASFAIDTAAVCTGGVISFVSTNTGGIINSYSWNFGNGATSTAANPSQSFLPGTYTIVLTVSGPAGSSSTSQILTIYPTPLVSACAANTTTSNAFSGIAKVSFAGINHRSGSALEGYQDVSCFASDTVRVGQNYILEVEVFNANDDVVAWIDYNNDGQFDASESVMLSTNVVFGSPPVHSATVTIPSSVVLNTLLYMRVIADDNYNTANGACYNITNGQAEDYGIVIEDPTGISASAVSSPLTLTAYPNPTNGLLTIEGRLAVPNGEANITISNVVGQKITERSIKPTSGSFKETFNLSDLRAGVYFVRVAGQHQSRTIKVVVKK